MSGQGQARPDVKIAPQPSIDAIAAQLPDLFHQQILLPLLFDYSATFIWALSGALIAARRGYVGIGILVIAVVSSTGGGILRDSMLLRTVPAVLTNAVYVLIGIGAFLIVITAGRFIDRTRWIGPAVHFVDALGAAVYAVVGCNLAIAAKLPFAGIVIVGFINAIGGGLLRDVLMRRVPDLFKPGLPFGPASVLAALFFTLLATKAGVGQREAAFMTIGAISIINFIILRYDIKSRPLETFRQYWESRE